MHLLIDAKWEESAKDRLPDKVIILDVPDGLPSEHYFVYYFREKITTILEEMFHADPGEWDWQNLDNHTHGGARIPLKAYCPEKLGVCYYYEVK